MKKKVESFVFKKFVKDSKTVSFKDLKILKKNSKIIKKNTRYCLHDHASEMNEMIIYQNQDLFFPPKKNVKSDQSFLIIEGKLLVIIFDDNGKIKKK